MSDNPYIDTVLIRLMQAGFQDATIVADRYQKDCYGDAEVVVKLPGFWLRFIRDQGQEFLDLAPFSSPEEFHPIEDVEVALGWRTLDDILARAVPEKLGSIMKRVKERQSDLAKAFAGDEGKLLRKKVSQVTDLRGNAIAERLEQASAVAAAP